MWKRILCVLPLVLFSLSVSLRFVPLQPYVEETNGHYRLYWTNFVYEYHLSPTIDSILSIVLFALALVGVQGSMDSPWKEARRTQT